MPASSGRISDNILSITSLLSEVIWRMSIFKWWTVCRESTIHSSYMMPVQVTKNFQIKYTGGYWPLLVPSFSPLSHHSSLSFVPFIPHPSHSHLSFDSHSFLQSPPYSLIYSASSFTRTKPTDEILKWLLPCFHICLKCISFRPQTNIGHWPGIHLLWMFEWTLEHWNALSDSMKCLLLSFSAILAVAVLSADSSSSSFIHHVLQWHLQPGTLLPRARPHFTELLITDLEDTSSAVSILSVSAMFSNSMKLELLLETWRKPVLGHLNAFGDTWLFVYRQSSILWKLIFLFLKWSFLLV